RGGLHGDNPAARIRPVWLTQRAPGRPQAARRLELAHEIALAEFDAAMAQNGVGGCGVEIKVRQLEVEEQTRALEQGRPAAERRHRIGASRREGNVARLGTFELRWRKTFDKRDRP